MCDLSDIGSLFGGGSEAAMPAAASSIAPAVTEGVLEGMPAATSGWGDIVGSAGGGIPWGDVTSAIKPYFGPALTAGSMLYGANQQSKMAKDLAGAQGRSYNQYLNALNPPDATKEAMFNKVNSQILSSAPVMMRKVSNELASRGVRGQGLASPITGAQKGITEAGRTAYLDIYGRYNAPQVTPPVNYSPSTGNLMGKNVSDIGTLMMMKQIFG